ncbi:MAG TPA: DUF1501 domain-containing protein [Planctomycetaceae bacterium]|nr:DUF1501 domain-containing protein [Planctomycetaceae bacterium]
MLSLLNGTPRLICSRRDFLRTGRGLAAAGLLLPEFATANPGLTMPGARGTFGRAKSCILVYLLGGPPHLDMWDLKPEAPAEVRGPFRPIPTNSPGVEVCDLLPRLAQMADRYALLRSVSHRNSNHTPMIYYTLTGRPVDQPEFDNDVRPPQATDVPHMGSVVASLKPRQGSLPGFIAIPEVAVRSSTRGEFQRARTPLRGGGPGFLGSRFAPLCVNGDPGTPDGVPALAPPAQVPSGRFERRTALLSLLERRAAPPGPSGLYDELRQQAVVLSGASGQGGADTFSLAGEPESLRERYGRHRFGRAMLLARRLAGAGVPMVAIHFNEMTVCDGWDTHSGNFDALKSELLPMVDQSLSALLEDLDLRGMLDETLVVVMGEFGRTPKINANAGRDHWGDCSSVLLAGGGLHMGQVIGASDKQGAYPQTDPIDPVDVQATIYHALGLDPHVEIHDQFQRPWAISTGRVIGPLV